MIKYQVYYWVEIDNGVYESVVVNEFDDYEQASNYIEDRPECSIRREWV